MFGKKKEIPQELIQPIIKRTEKAISATPIYEVKEEFIKAFKKFYWDNANFRKMKYIEGVIISQVRKYEVFTHYSNGEAFSFMIRDSKGTEIKVFVPYEEIIKSPIRPGNVVGIKGHMHFYERGFRDGFSCIEFSAYEVKNVGTMDSNYSKLLDFIRKNKRKERLKLFGKKYLRVALITSETSEAKQDIHNVLDKNRFFKVDDYYTSLFNPEGIANRIEQADSKGYDAIIIARGGTEKLDVFSRIEILNAIYRCKTLVISAIGHASSKPLSNVVADVAVDTPSAAASYLVRMLDKHKYKKVIAIISVIGILMLYGYVQLFMFVRDAFLKLK